MRIKPETDSELEVTAIALVDAPAIAKNFLAFKGALKLEFATINEDEHIIVGPAMVPDTLIYRNDKDLGEYNVFFSKETIKEIAQKYYKKCLQGSANLMHDPEQKLEGINYFLSWFKDTAKGMTGLDGDYPEGTWFVGAKVDNADAWAKIKSGEIKGFSVEGVFGYVKEEPAPVQMSDDERSATELLQKINEILNGKTV